MRIKLKRGLELALAGEPEQRIYNANDVRTVALVGPDYAGLKPVLEVAQGDAVRLGQPLLTDRRYPEIRYTAPAAGRVLAIHRGARRRLLSVVIEVGDAEPLRFEAHDRGSLAGLPANRVRSQLLASGLWTAIRARPFDGVPPPDALPVAIAVTAMDTNALSADPAVVLGGRFEAFADGIAVLGRLTDRVYVCKSPSLALPDLGGSEARVVEFTGPHPAGLPGTHIAHLSPVSVGTQTWHVGCQDVIAIGELFVSGRLSSERVVAVGGPAAARPRLLRTRIGASLDDLLDGEAKTGARRISGSVLAGRAVRPETAYLGRYHTQVAVIDDDPRQAAVRPRARGAGTTAMHGAPSGMIGVEAFERVWPLPGPVLPLLRALLVEDADAASALGCLDLAEEDLAACAYVCPAKQDYGASLRSVLREFEPGIA